MRVCFLLDYLLRRRLSSHRPLSQLLSESLGGKRGYSAFPPWAAGRSFPGQRRRQCNLAPSYHLPWPPSRAATEGRAAQMTIRLGGAGVKGNPNGNGKSAERQERNPQMTQMYADERRPEFWREEAKANSPCDPEFSRRGDRLRVPAQARSALRSDPREAVVVVLPPVARSLGFRPKCPKFREEWCKFR
jgi:hypothetical protein